MIKTVDKIRGEAIFSEYEATERQKKIKSEEKGEETPYFQMGTLQTDEMPRYIDRNPVNQPQTIILPAVKIKKPQSSTRQCPVNTKLPKIRMPRGPRVRGSKR